MKKLPEINFIVMKPKATSDQNEAEKNKSTFKILNSGNTKLLNEKLI